MQSSPTRFRIHFPSLLGLGLVLLMTWAPAPRAHAQLGAVAQAMEPEYFTRDLLIFIEGLNLDETQTVIAEAIFDDYEQKFDAGLLQMKEQTEAIAQEIKDKNTQDPDKILEMVVQPIQDWMIQSEELNTQLIENVRVILVPEQQSLWTEFNRRLYRDRKLDEGRLSGERVDLFVVARDTSVDISVDPAKSLFNTYSLELDSTLRSRQKLIEGETGNLLNALQNRSDNPNVDIDTKKKIEKHRVRIRDINDMYREEIANVLTPELGDAFRNEALRRGYAKIFRTTNAERVFDDALAVYDPAGEGELADADTYEAIWSLYSEFLARLADLNSRLYATTRSSEPELAMIKIENATRRANGEEIIRPEDPVRALQQEKRELEREYIDRLRALLGDESFAELNGARRYLPPAEFDPNNPSMGNDENRLLQLQRPAGGGKGDLPKGGKPDDRPDAPAKDLGNGAGVAGGTGNRDD